MPITERELNGLEETRVLLAEMARALLRPNPQGSLDRVEAATSIVSAQQAAHSRVQKVSDGIILLDQRGLITEFNEAAERIFGHARCRVLGQHATMLFLTPEDDGLPALSIESGQAGSKKSLNVSPQVLGLRRNGTTLAIDLRVSEFSCNDQPCFLLLVRDRSERGAERGAEPEAEEETEQKADCSQSKQRLAFALTGCPCSTDRWRQRREHRVDSESLATLGQLAARVGNDLREPLLAIRNAHSYVNQRLAVTKLANSPRMVQMLKIIDRELSVAVKIVGELLDFAQERKVHRAPCPLAPLVDDALSTVRQLTDDLSAGVREVWLSNEISHTLPALELDREQMLQVLVNLMQNATEAIPAGKRGVVRVMAHTAANEVHLTVSDNGEGISPKDLPRVLEPLFTTKAHGMGLGLAVADSIVKRHGGTLEVESQHHIGTTFTVRLPLIPPSKSLPSL